MNDTTITFRTSKILKEEASTIFKDSGLNLSEAINHFLEETVRCGRNPLAVQKSDAKDYTETYPDGFFELFGSGTEDDMDFVVRTIETDDLEEM